MGRHCGMPRERRDARYTALNSAAEIIEKYQASYLEPRLMIYEYPSPHDCYLHPLGGMTNTGDRLWEQSSGAASLLQDRQYQRDRAEYIGQKLQETENKLIP